LTTGLCPTITGLPDGGAGVLPGRVTSKTFLGLGVALSALVLAIFFTFYLHAVSCLYDISKMVGVEACMPH
jgi:hypothetical protein